MTIDKKTCRLKIRRGGATDVGSFNSFNFTFEEGQSVLDALQWIRETCDPSLAMRFSCINANACKECVMLINGRASYACTSRLVSGDMLIEPLPNKRLIRDLVTEIVPPVEQLSMGNFIGDSD